MKTYKAIIFDLDNTLLDRDITFRGFSEKLVDYYFSHHDAHVKETLIEQIRIADQDGYRNKLEMFTEFAEVLPWSEKPDVTELYEFYKKEYVQSAVLMEMALDLLVHCKGSYKLGLITNGFNEIQYGKIHRLELAPYFDTIIVSEEVNIKKPDPRIFQFALDQLRVNAEEAIYIGDHPINDIQGAGRSGMDTIWMSRNQTWVDTIEVQPIQVVRKLDELLAYLREL